MGAVVMEETPPNFGAPAPAGPAQQRVADIISRGRQVRPGALSAWVLSLLTAGLMWAAFPPVDVGPLAWVCLVPVLQLVRIAQPARWMYRSLYFAGLLYWLVSLQWMRLGDPAMYLALGALAAYQAVYWPAFVWLSRTATRRLGAPLVLAAPVLWTGLEFLRAHLLTGFAWYFLGHSQWRWTEIVQISDLIGAYGVSFVIVAANAAAAQWISPQRWERWHLCWPDETSPQQQRWLASSRWPALAAALALVAAAWGYGTLRRGGEFPIGPRVALIQGNFVATVKNDRDDPREIYLTHRHLSGLTVSERPDVIIWPEGMFPYPLFEAPAGMTDKELSAAAPEIPVAQWRDKQSQGALDDLAQMTGAALVIGCTVFVPQTATYAVYNSALLMQPGAGATNRYDKIHRVPFGEYIPFRDQLPWLQSLTPFRGKFGIDRGEKAHVFRLKDWQLIPVICFEDTVPHLVRRLAASAHVNAADSQACLVNISNDGWFHGSSELEQHLITATFRAIETRTPVVRAVNTGISGVIDGDGVIREPAKFFDLDARSDGIAPRLSMRSQGSGRFHRQLNCALVADVPLDPRSSFYVAGGDWFAFGCLIACLGVGFQGVFIRPRSIGPAN